MPERMTWQERYAALAEVSALETLMKSEWVTEELENANYHSLYGSFGFFAEMLQERKSELDHEDALSTLEVQIKMDPDVPVEEKVRIAMNGLPASMNEEEMQQVRDTLSSLNPKLT